MEESGPSKVCARTNVHQFAYPSLSKLEGVVAKLEPLSDQHAFIRFLRNVDDAKTLSGFVQELVNAITDYQVRTTGPTVSFKLMNIRPGFGTTRSVR